MATLKHYFLEPVNTLTHLVGAIASLAGLVLLLELTRDEPPKLLSMFVYGSTTFLLYIASTLLHGAKTTWKNHVRLNRLDHVAIFLSIAGTYTPIAYNLIPDPWRWRLLSAVWLVTLAGAVYKIIGVRIHGFFNVSLYLLLGWGSAVPLIWVSNLISLIPLRGLLLLLLGGLIYTVGFIIYYLERPDPWPEVFGHHEIWHVLVLIASLCHFLFIWLYVVPYEPTT